MTTAPSLCFGKSMKSGLEVQDLGGVWHPIRGRWCPVNIGDLLQRWTNDYFVSTKHRVVNTS